MKTTYLKNLELNYNFKRQTYNPPVTWYVGLSTTSVDASGVATEPSASTGYARVAVTNDATKWSVSSIGELFNLSDITFPEATTSQGTVLDVVLYDAQTGGNAWYYEPLPTPRLIQSGAASYFAPQGFKIKTL